MSRANAPVDAGDGAQRIAAFLRHLAAQAESDPTLASTLQSALEESGLLAPAKTSRTARSPKRAGGAQTTAPGGRESDGRPAAPIDPFVVYRERGPDALRAVLAEHDLATLRGLIRAHRLDPARISARWTAPDRLIGLIVQQVQARANIGRAFAHV